MRNRPSVWALMVFSLISSCKGGCVDEYSSFFCVPSDNQVCLTIDSLSLECIQPEVSGISYVGYSDIFGDHLYFADRLFASLYQFDKNGLFEKVVIRNGNGPHEIPISRFEGYCISDDGHHFFLDSSTNIFEYDKEFNLINRLFCYWKKKITKGKSYEQTDSYSTCWGDKVNLTVYNGKLYTNITGASETFNILAPDYYHLARIIEPRDAQTGDPYPLLGRLSPEVRYMTAFQGDYFRITKEGAFVVAYEADDLMYVYDSCYQLQYAFGQPGYGMNKDYQPLSVNHFQETLSQELETRGRYTSLSLVGDLTFRTYLTGTPFMETRLQIYNGTTFIGDVQVPDGFKVLGYINPYYYSYFICDEDKELIRIYRFML